MKNFVHVCGDYSLSIFLGIAVLLSSCSKNTGSLWNDVSIPETELSNVGCSFVLQEPLQGEGFQKIEKLSCAAAATTLDQEKQISAIQSFIANCNSALKTQNIKPEKSRFIFERRNRADSYLTTLKLSLEKDKSSSEQDRIQLEVARQLYTTHKSNLDTHFPMNSRSDEDIECALYTISDSGENNFKHLIDILDQTISSLKTIIKLDLSLSETEVSKLNAELASYEKAYDAASKSSFFQKEPTASAE